jgi:hypothetical protein
MTAARALAAVLLFAAAPVQAQIPPGWQPRPGAPAFDRNRYQADQHRYEINRLRAQADQRETVARQQQMEAGLARQRLEAARQPAIQPEPPATLRSPEEQRALRLSAEQRRRALADGVGQIDAWLDRPAN